MPTLQSILRGIDRFNYVLMALSAVLLYGVLATRPGFVRQIQVRNGSAAPIEFTPVAAWRPDERRGVLPVVISSRVPLPAWQYAGFRLAPGEAMWLLYDAEGCDLAELVVGDDRGNIGELPAAPIAGDTFAVVNVAALAPVRPHVKAGASSASRDRRVNAAAYYALLFAPWAAFVLFRIFLRGPYVSPAEQAAWDEWAAGAEGT